MRSSTFKYQSEELVYRILVKAVNDRDDMGFDVFEFYANRNPFARELLVSSLARFHNYTFLTTFNISTVNLTLGSLQKGWYDAEDDKYDKLSYHLYASTKQGRFLIMPSIYQHSTFIFTVPHL
jgi:hypothetical protein